MEADFSQSHIFFHSRNFHVPIRSSFEFDPLSFALKNNKTTTPEI